MLLKNKFTPLKLIYKSRIPPCHSLFRFKLDGKFKTRAGEFVAVRSPDQTITRYYSPTSIDGDDYIELLIHLEGANLVQIFKNLEIGDYMYFAGPFGDWGYTKCYKHLLLICENTAITPMIQIIRTVLADPNDDTNIVLLYHADNEEKILFKDELDNYAKEGKIKVYYSVDEPPEGWKGDVGQIDQTMIEKYAKFDREDCQVVVCMYPEPSKEMDAILEKMKFPNTAFLEMKVLTILILSLIAFTFTKFNPNRLHLIDHSPKTNNFLFRGNVPVTKDDKYAYDELKYTLREKARANNVTLGEDFYIVQISFLNSIIEGKYIKICREFYEKNKNLGQFIHWGILGQPFNGTAMNETLREQRARGHPQWDHDSMNKRIEQIHHLLHNEKRDVPIVIYIQCAAGVDRTGQMSGGYYIRFLKWSYLKALTFDYQVGKRPITVWAENGLNWYCWYLYYTHGYPMDCNAWLPR